MPADPAPPDLSVSVVTYQSAHCLEGLFASLDAQTGVTFELFVVDNASRDGTADWLRRQARGSVTVNAENVGYGRAHNQNLTAFAGRHVLLLNPDLEFGDGVFAALVRFLDEHPDHAAVGPNVLEGPGRRPFAPRHFYPGERAVPLTADLPRDEVAWISGCAIAVRRDDLLGLGGFDPDFFLYHEETDLCLRARRQGAKIGWCREACVHHARHQSQVDLSGYERASNLIRGTLRFWEKHYDEREVARIAQFRRLVASTRLALHRVGLRPDEDAHAYLRAERDLYRAWLDAHPGCRLAASTGLWRIAAHQLRLALEGARHGWFPVDAV